MILSPLPNPLGNCSARCSTTCIPVGVPEGEGGYRAIDSYTMRRLRRWVRNKYKFRRNGGTAYPDVYLYETLSLVRLSRLEGNVPWAKA